MTDQLAEQPFSTVFAYALQGHPCAVIGDDTAVHLPVDAWTRHADDGDHAILDHCTGATLDVGCGPGRMTAALVERGHLALGIDVVQEAVGQTLERGASALLRDVYDDLPGEGRWESALLADGNVGIGGDPVSLLRRIREILDPRGRIVVEVAAPGVAHKTSWMSLECAGARSRRFRWSVVGVDDVAEIAADAGLRVVATARHGDRWCVVLEGRT